MKLYIANGIYVGTQADAKRADKHFTQVEVPTDKEGLMAYLNATQVDSAKHQDLAEDWSPHAQAVCRDELHDGSDLIDDGSDLVDPEPRMSATAVLARSDAGSDIDLQVQRIMKSRGHVLIRYAKAVALAFEGLR